MKQHILIGRTIKAMQIASDKMAIRFQTDGGDVIAKTDGDCCSQTWIEHIELPALGFPAVVVSVEDIELSGSTREDDNYECLQVYGCKITTDRGEIVIDYRNSSNGYYGGNLWWPNPDGDDSWNSYYGGVYGQNVSTEKFVAITP